MLYRSTQLTVTTYIILQCGSSAPLSGDRIKVQEIIPLEHFQIHLIEIS